MLSREVQTQEYQFYLQREHHDEIFSLPSATARHNRDDCSCAHYHSDQDRKSVV